MVLGESKSCTGRVILLTVTTAKESVTKEDTTADDQADEAANDPSGDPAHSHSQPDHDPASTARRFKVVVNHPESHPVMCVGALEGMLLAGVGTKLTTYVYRDSALVVFAFYMGGFGVSAMSTLRRYVLVGDVHTGCQLLVWKPEKQCLVLVSKHSTTASAFACEFMLHDEGALHLILSEEGPTLRMMNYNRQLPESRRGTVLVPRASFHVGLAALLVALLAGFFSGLPSAPTSVSWSGAVNRAWPSAQLKKPAWLL